MTTIITYCQSFKTDNVVTHSLFLSSYDDNILYKYINNFTNQNVELISHADLVIQESIPVWGCFAVAADPSSNSVSSICSTFISLNDQVQFNHLYLVLSNT